jgi:hypothetical protein
MKRVCKLSSVVKVGPGNYPRGSLEDTTEAHYLPNTRPARFIKGSYFFVSIEGPGL